MKLAALGDSNTGNNRNPYYVAASETYFQLVSAALGYETAINAGVSGDTAGGGLARLQADVIAYSPSVCTVMFGTNEVDGSITANTQIDALISSYRSNIDGIITALLAASIKPVIVSPPFALRARAEGRLAALRDSLRELCIRRNVAFVDLFGKMQEDSNTQTASYFNQWFMDIGGTPDTYHIGVTGHQRIANTILAGQLAIGSSTPPPSPPEDSGTVLNATLDGNFGNIDGKTIKVRIKAAQLSPPSGAVTKIRLGLQGHADEPLTLAKLYIGQKATSGDAYDAASLSQMKVGGSSAFTVPQGTQVWTDWLTFSWDKTSDLIVSLYCNAGANADKMAAASPSAIGDTHLKNGDEAATANATGFTAYNGYLSLVAKIETDGFTE